MKTAIILKDAPWRFVLNPHHAIGYVRAANGRSFATIAWENSAGYQHHDEERRLLQMHGELMASAPELLRQRDALATALRDVIAAFESGPDILITHERIEAWKQVLESTPAPAVNL